VAAVTKRAYKESIKSLLAPCMLFFSRVSIAQFVFILIYLSLSLSFLFFLEEMEWEEGATAARALYAWRCRNYGFEDSLIQHYYFSE
jgi:hypothetical protein